MNMQAPIKSTIRTTCPYCGVGCGVLAKPDGRGGAEISGDPDHPANFGKLCSKGTALGETLGLKTRLLHPMARDATGEMQRVSWDAALDKVAGGFRQVIERHGPDSVAFYLSGQLLTEDYYVANKLMKGFIGSANVDTNSRLCMASSVAAHRRAFGSDTVPGCYEDFDEAHLIVLIGSNAAWCHPVLFRRMVENRERHGAKIVVIDPRRTATAEEADLFLPVAPGMDTVLFSGLLADLADKHALDFAYISQHTDGFEAALARAREIAPSLEAVSSRTGLSKKDILAFYEMFRTTKRVVTAFSQGVNQSAQGTDKANAIINCHLATGRIGKAGTGPFSLTGQPNAMGGREVGGLANQLAAHMNFMPEDIDRVGRFWNAAAMAKREGLKAVQMFEAIERGEIKALWVMATNPAVSLPRADAVRAALAKLELFVVSENVHANDTVASGAHILLPAAAWGEKDGTVTNSERRISRQRGFLAQPGEAKPDWKIVSEVAARMGFSDAFAYSSAADIFREHAALSTFENNGTRDFDIGAFKNISDESYEQLEPVLWPLRAKNDLPQQRFFDEGGFFSPNRRAKLVALEIPKLSEETADQYPFRLNTGRVRDQWHTMTRTGLSPKLSQHLPEPFAEISPEDARRSGIANGDFVRLRSAHGEVVVRARIEAGQQRGSLFVPIHWNDETASSARICSLVTPATDPLSGQPEAKATPVALERVAFAQSGFVLSSGALSLPRDLFWSRVPLEGGEGMLFAADRDIAFWRGIAEACKINGAETAEYIDERRGIFRVAHIENHRLTFCIFVSPSGGPPAWDNVKQALALDRIDARRRALLLSGSNPAGIADSGPLVCACFGVGLQAIRTAIETGAACNIDEIGVKLRAGTNCGSCKPELKRILHDVRAPQAV
jgi:assimilatory nitrate reductase catalytic subunit